MNQKACTAAVLAAVLAIGFSGCVADETTPRPGGPKVMHLETGRELIGGTETIDWNTLDWLQGIEPPTWEYEPEAPIRILHAYANVTYEFPQPLLGGGVRTDLTTWHGYKDEHGAFMSSHRFFDHTDQNPETVTAYFDMEMPRGGLAIGAGQTYAVSIGHYYTDGKGDAAPTAHANVTIVYEPLTPVNYARAGQASIELLGGLCVVPADIDAQHSFELPIESLQGFYFTTMQNRANLGDVDFVVHWNGERIMHGAGPGRWENVTLTEAGMADMNLGDILEVTVFNCHPNLNQITYAWGWGQA
ncbi:MAG: hypothetical protein ACPHK8_00870 [Thermoplasmatota archaeon]